MWDWLPGTVDKLDRDQRASKAFPDMPYSFFVFFIWSCQKAQTCAETNLGWSGCMCTLAFIRRVNCSIWLIFWFGLDTTTIYTLHIVMRFAADLRSTTISLMGMDHVGNKLESWLKQHACCMHNFLRDLLFWFSAAFTPHTLKIKQIAFSSSGNKLVLFPVMLSWAIKFGDAKKLAAKRKHDKRVWQIVAHWNLDSFVAATSSRLDALHQKRRRDIWMCVPLITRTYQWNCKSTVKRQSKIISFAVGIARYLIRLCM